jgi:hypothetical protein
MRAAIPPLPNTPFWRGAQLKDRDKFVLTFTFDDGDKIRMQVLLQKFF